MAETRIEGASRAAWLRYVCEEARAAVRMGVPVEGICLHPVLGHLGWDDDRYCPNGLSEMEAQQERRIVHAPLAAELHRQQALFGALFDGHHRLAELERAQSCGWCRRAEARRAPPRRSPSPPPQRKGGA